MAQKDLPYWQADELKAGVVEMMLIMVMVVMRTTADISHLMSRNMLYRYYLA